MKQASNSESSVERQIALTLRLARLRAHMTQRELANRAGVTQNYISRIETCGCNPSVHSLERIAKGLGMTVHIEFVLQVKNKEHENHSKNFYNV